MPSQPPTLVTTPLAAFVVLGDGGIPWARAITAESSCPVITLDGKPITMQMRVPAGTLPARRTASAAADSKPSAFPVLTCELRVPPGTRIATIGERELRLPKVEPKRIVIIGDTGCRMKLGERAWQRCNDENEWPFRVVANSAAALKPDLVIHVGDYHYRDNACPATEAGCQGSPWGYGWDVWQADLFAPAASLFAAAPWVVARGNHEECRRAGQGWFRFLDVQPFEEARSCNDAKHDADANFSRPYSVPISSGLQLIVFDSAIAGHAPLEPAKSRDKHAIAKYQQQFTEVDALAGKTGVNSIFINHHPILGYAPADENGVHGGGAAQLSVMRLLHPITYYPSTVDLALHGHVHLFQAINFSSNHPATIVSGTGGNQLDPALPEPFPLNIAPAGGVAVESITHDNEFGFVLMEKQESRWQLRAYDRNGVVRTTCQLTGSKLRCDKKGLIKEG